MSTAGPAPRPAGLQPVAAGLAAIDPGRSKCGLVRADPTGERILAAGILDPQSCWQILNSWQQQGLVVGLLLGDGTGSQPWLARCATAGVPVQLVAEAGTTLAARTRFWQLEPARGWRRLLPQGLRLPPRDVDDVVAQLLLERHLGRMLDRRGAQWLRSGPER